jgi:DNA methylase
VSAHANPTNNLELPPLTASEEIRDICRESELTPGEVHAEYLNLNGQITTHLDTFVGKIVDATEEFKNLILPLLDQMQSLLSKRGSRRKLLNIAGIPTWEEWYRDFENRLHLDISFRTIQRWLKQYREAEMEEPPAPDANALAKQSVRYIESNAQAEKLESVVKHRKQVDPANRANLIRALKADVETKLALIAKLEKGFTLPVTEMGKALPFTQAETAKAAREQAAYWRKEGFPFHDKSETERGRELHLLLDFDHSNLINDGVVRQTMHGLGTAGSYFPHMMSVRSGKFRTPMEVFEDDNLFPKAIEKRIEAVGRLSLTANDIRKACMTYCGSHAVSNFKPSAAAAIYNKYLPETGGVVFDPSAGFGGRFLGALACRKVKRYVFCDPATETFKGLEAMASEVGNAARKLRRDMGVEPYHCGSEDMRPNLQHSSVDCVLWSPPYYDKEKYSTEPTQSYLKFPTRESWLEGFIGATLDNIAFALKPEGVLAVNIADVPTFPDLEKAFLALAESKGWTRTETLHIELSPMWGTREPGYEPKLEPLFVFRRGESQ